MEDEVITTEKNIKVRMSTLIISIIFIIILVILVIGTINLNKENNILQTRLSEVQTENKSLKDIIEKKFGKDYILAGYDFDNIDLLQDNKSVYNSKIVQDFTIDEIKKAISDYIAIADLYAKSKEDLILKLGLTNRKKLQDYGETEIEDEFYSTDINFEDYKNKMLQYMTLDCFKENFCDEIKSLNGKLYYSYFELTNPGTHSIIDIKKEVDEENTFYVQLKDIVHDKYDNTDTEYKKEGYFIITGKDGKPIVDSTDILL